MTRAEIKEKSKKQIRGHIGMFFLINLIVVALAVVGNVIGYIPFIGVALSLLASIGMFLFYPFIAFNLMRIYWNFATRGKDPKPKNLFKDDFGQMWWKAWGLYIEIGFFTMLWSFLLIVPGIIKAISYSAAPYILASNPEISAPEAVRQSKKIMKGHKADFFVMVLSFIGWVLLACLTLGILLIWLAPYMETTYANFYASIGVGGNAPTNVIEDKPAEAVDAE